MPWLIVIGLIALPVIEIALFIKSAQWIGVLPTVLLAILAGMAGVSLVRTQGLSTLMRARSQMERGEIPLAEAFDGICITFAGALLFLPGFFSDFVALALLLPPVRAALRRLISGNMRTVVAQGGFAAGPRPHDTPPGRPPVIDADYHVVDDGTGDHGPDDRTH